MLTKDGKRYELRQPPKFLQNWDLLESELTYYNFESFGQKINLPWRREPAKRSIAETVLPKPEPLTQPEPEQITPEEPKKPASVTTVERKSTLENSVLMHCLPNQTGKFGQTFDVEAVVVEMTDFTAKFWTNLAEFGTGSIVYPYEYGRGGPVLDFRWWKVYKVTPSKDGWIYDATVSDMQPDFT